MAALAFGGIRPLTSKEPSMGECICGHVGRAACWAAWLPRVSAHERGCYSGNILSPHFPALEKSAASMDRGSWESPKGRQFVAVEVNIAKWVEKKPGLLSVW